MPAHHLDESDQLLALLIRPARGTVPAKAGLKVLLGELEHLWQSRATYNNKCHTLRLCVRSLEHLHRRPAADGCRAGGPPLEQAILAEILACWRS